MDVKNPKTGPTSINIVSFFSSFSQSLALSLSHLFRRYDSDDSKSGVGRSPISRSVIRAAQFLRQLSAILFDFGCVRLLFGESFYQYDRHRNDTTMLSGNKLKIKFSCKRVEADSGKVVESNDGKVSRDFGHSVSAKGLSSLVPSSIPGGRKRGPLGDGEVPREKKLKMDRKVKSQCSTILSALISHKDSWAFRKPVDPVELQIPDYLDVISSPMDLGTIKTKLDRNMYFGAGEFASDVRLTFSNAMLYNPPGNPFHQMAKDLNTKFEMKWRLLDVKLSQGSSKVDAGKNLCGQIKKITEISDTRLSHKFIPIQNVSVTKFSVPCKENVGTGYGASDGEILLATTVKATPKLLGKNLDRGCDSVGRQSSGSKSGKQPPSLVGSKCGTCGNITCHCSLRTEYCCSSENYSEGSLGKEQNRHLSSANLTGLDCQAITSSASRMSKSDPESDGAVSALDEETICPSSHFTSPVTDAASGEEWSTPIFSVPLSPKKALRAAILKRRFADTILKAQQKSLLDQGNRTDPLKMQQEKARLERKQREEKARIEAEIRAAEAAAQRQAEIELKERHAREREEARIALEKMERTVVFEQNCSILDELKTLAGYNGGSWGSHFRSPLERLGLFIKDDHTVEVDESEEGEIL
ncbi:transcription factor GTE12-like [Argentina anserina]|uniref:transcription factor GTE12-like n=1 Tax=Argentina anserina TaxID=57926 RepID=UPI00217641F3|nr:transcription factor GTE12-like [Potentilla anserina]